MTHGSMATDPGRPSGDRSGPDRRSAVGASATRQANVVDSTTASPAPLASSCCILSILSKRVAVANAYPVCALSPSQLMHPFTLHAQHRQHRVLSSLSSLAAGPLQAAPDCCDTCGSHRSELYLPQHDLRAFDAR